MTDPLLPDSGMQDRDGLLMERDDLPQLWDALLSRGYEVVGPTVDQGAIVYDRLLSPDGLPQGWTEEQGPGKYRLVRRSDEELFGYVVGPHSWKKYLFPPYSTLTRSDRTENVWDIRPVEEAPQKRAFVGVRACELAAIAIQDKVFLHGPYVDPIYAARRSNTLIVAVNCTQSAPTCFCTSMNTGPRCTSGFDLALTEIADGFTVEIGSEAGRELAAALPLRKSTADERTSADQRRKRAVEQISRTMNTDGIRNLLFANLEHPRWNEVATRCLSCANCTQVCPTCFCSAVEDVPDLTGDHVERQRHWDSCFNPDFSYLNGGLVRQQVSARYRQWLTHKLAGWNDQFGTSGCVGCGRCITWCPVGIDLTEEVAAIRGESK